MPKVRAYGADATLKACRGRATGGAALRLPEPRLQIDRSSPPPSRSADDPLLGRGRNAQDPYRGLITDEGQLDVPFDRCAGTGFWLTGLFSAIP